jgi:hypothetical protein
MHAARLLCACALLGAAGLQVAAATGIGKPFTDEMMAERKKAWVSYLHAPARCGQWRRLKSVMTRFTRL